MAHTDDKEVKFDMIRYEELLVMITVRQLLKD